MLKNSSKILFLMTLMSGTFITISSTSWLGAWMGLEINLLSFIPLMNDNNNLMSTEAALKYFLVQAIASSIFLIAVLIWMLKSASLSNMGLYNNMMIISTLLIKSGTAPFHFWFPNVMEGLNWINSLILMTWQKIAPMMLISYIYLFNMMFYIIIISAIVGSIGGLNQSSLRKLMAFSSINHLSWMLAAMMNSNNFWLIYFMFYSIMSMIIIFFLNSYKIYYFNQLFMLPPLSNTMKFSFFMNLLSLGGLPPFLGFLPKWMIIQQLSIMNQMLLLTIMIFMSLITLFFYLRLCYASIMIGHIEYNWNFSFFMNNFYYNKFLLLTFISMTGLIFISVIYNII